MEWSIEDVFKIISLYRQFPCLWDYKSPYYKRVDMKKNAWSEIAKNMNKEEGDEKENKKFERSICDRKKRKLRSLKSLVQDQMVFTSRICFISKN
ncbi:hypothetical protein EVAR_73059_1 [Eumeta japonica]|uniref:MADF domain-containing protein n=1 Tax=Eumeta variegata TaxID=151549 RepID=A0A4C1SGW2_EUMVA|nr:hypothetical protein EVAR_73059_1 [Eumeta japonica]